MVGIKIHPHYQTVDPNKHGIESPIGFGED